MGNSRPKSKAKQTKAKPNWRELAKSWNQAWQRPTRKLIWGMIFIFSALFLLLALLAYFEAWRSDQSLVVFKTWEIFREPSLQVNNRMGKIGAALGHLLVFRSFGLAAFLFPLLLFLVGLRLALGFRPYSLRRALGAVLFFSLWLPTALAFLLPQKSHWAGANGYALEQWLASLAGAGGSAIILVLSLLIFTALRRKWTPEKIRHWLLRWREKQPRKNPAAAQEELLGASPPEPEVSNAPAEELSLELETSEEEAPAQLAPEEGPPAEGELDLEIAPSAEAEESKTQESATENDFEIEAQANEESLSERELNRKLKEFGEYDPTLELSHFKLPTLELLRDYGSTNIRINEQELSENKNKIVETLNNYNIEISKIKATIGPTVTLYEIIPAPGVRISKIKSLEDDIALSLSALGIRIIAPIPGRGTIGIEVPSTSPQMVPMRNLISGEKFQSSEADLPIAMGKTISNETYVFDLAKMPHLLMAGATGQGKSVGLNVILTSLLYKKHPSQVKFVLVDPKKVELTLFNKIERHYLAKLPDTEEAIITDTSKVVATLNSLCIEMDNRYELLKNAMVRNIKEYNSKFIQRRLNPEEGHHYLPYIVLVIDEFADLIMTAGKEVETPIARLAQLARAIGIHLIVATQRPSVNVITGIIKANFPARIAFRVSSKIDSRTILDAGGAEQLIGKGDMLMSQGQDLLRLQCAFVDTPEVEDITDYIGNQRAYPEAYQLPEYKSDEDESGIEALDPADRDKLFEDAARLVVIHQQGSASFLQRKLKLGYNRAGRIVDQLEAAGIIGSFEGSKAREVLIRDEMSLEQLLNNES